MNTYYSTHPTTFNNGSKKLKKIENCMILGKKRTWDGFLMLRKERKNVQSKKDIS